VQPRSGFGLPSGVEREQQDWWAKPTLHGWKDTPLSITSKLQTFMLRYLVLQGIDIKARANYHMVVKE